MNEPLERLPASVRAEIQSMTLAISRRQLTQEQAMQHIAHYCLSAPPRTIDVQGVEIDLAYNEPPGSMTYSPDLPKGHLEIRHRGRVLGVIINVGTDP